jgi:hypothetical protein
MCALACALGVTTVALTVMVVRRNLQAIAPAVQDGGKLTHLIQQPACFNFSFIRVYPGEQQFDLQGNL